MSILTEIRVPRRGSRRRTLVLDGEPWRDVASDVVAQTKLKAGADVDPDEMAAAFAQVEPMCARERAVRLLTYRDRSVGELGDRLTEDGYSSETIAEVVTRLTAAGFLDDDRFARSLARTLTQIRRLGRSRAARELASHGIDPELAAEALDEALSVEDEVVAAADMARPMALRTGATRDKIAARLVRRGYAPRIALAAAREAMDTAGREGEDGAWDEAEHVDGGDSSDGF